MRIMFVFLFLILLIACGRKRSEITNEVPITSASKQDSIFNSLLAITKHVIPEGIQNDSLAFLILPVQASCPSCRSKVIDSIVKHAENIRENRYVIVSANGGAKLVGSFFNDERAELPVGKNWLILDSINQGHAFKLYVDKPTIYYTHNRKAYKMVASIPYTVKNDLRDFFSGTSF